MPTVWDHAQAGPNALTTLDKILFGALILMAFELLDYISSHLGKWIHAKLIPVRGKQLDELSDKDIFSLSVSTRLLLLRLSILYYDMPTLNQILFGM